VERLERCAGRLAHDFGRLLERNGCEVSVEALAGAAPLLAQLTDELARVRLCPASLPSTAQARRVDSDRSTILVVDSDACERTALCRMLDPDQCEILEAADGAAALALCQQQRERIDVMLTDVLLEDMSGRELGERAGLSQPDLRVIYVSGYTSHDIVFYGILGPGVATLEKPVLPEALAEKLREALACETTAA
jgi:CheY-like chemotaxis protein